ncbi:unnamed protein product, partial [Coregonus sp. 'balchen']
GRNRDVQVVENII